MNKKLENFSILLWGEDALCITINKQNHCYFGLQVSVACALDFTIEYSVELQKGKVGIRTKNPIRPQR